MYVCNSTIIVIISVTTVLVIVVIVITLSNVQRQCPVMHSKCICGLLLMEQFNA